MYAVHGILMTVNGLFLTWNFINVRTTTPTFLWFVDVTLYQVRRPLCIASGTIGLVLGQFMRDNAFPMWYNKGILLVGCAAWTKILIDWYNEPLYSHPLGEKKHFSNHVALGHLIGLSLQFAPFLPKMFK